MKKHFLLKLFATVMLLAIALTALVACDAESLKVTFMLDEQEVYKVVDLESGDEVKLPEEPTKDGFVFDGWYLDKGTWEKQFFGKIEDPTVLAIVVYAKWTEGTTSENPPSGDLPSDKCKHDNTKKVELSVGCDYKYLVVCSDCGVVVDVQTVVMHTWSEEPKLFARESCLIGEHTAMYCLVCGVEKEDTIVYSEGEDGMCYAEHLDVTELTYFVDENGNLDTNACTSSKKRANVCLTCGEEFEVVTVVEASGHVFGDWEIVVKPTANLCGKIERACTVCGVVEDKVIPSLYKLDSEGYATADVNEYYVYEKVKGCSCSAEGRVDKYSFTAPDGKTMFIELNVRNSSHYIVVDNRKLDIQEGDVVEYIEEKFTVLNGGIVTCASFGTDATFKCDECGQSYSVKVRKQHAAYDSKYGEITNIVAATCTLPGCYTYNCRDCAQTVQAIIPALGHSFVLDESKGDGGMSIGSSDYGEKRFTIHVKCINDDCDVSASIMTDKFNVTEIAATCTEPAITIYTNIMVNGYVLTDSKGTPFEIKQVHGTPLGHAEGVVENGKYNIADLTAADVTLLGGSSLTCKDHDGSTDTAWKDAIYKCPNCDIAFSIKVCKSHEADADSVGWKYDIKPTCTESAVKTFTCKDCMKNVEIECRPLGHNWVYTLDAESKKIADFKCLNEDCDGGDEGSIAVGTKVVNVISPTCAFYGSAVAIVDGCEWKIILAKSAYHAFNGVVINGTADNPVNYMEGMVSFGGSAISCVAPKTKNVLFTCDCCGNNCMTYAVKAHELRIVVEKDATCTMSGIAHANCYVCGEQFDEIIPALGHAVSWTIESVSGTTVSIGMACSRCDFEENRTLDLFGCFASKYGSVVVDTSTLSEQSWEVKTIVAGTCSHTGVYRFTCDHIEGYLDEGKLVFTTPLTFDITYRATHDLVDYEYITWHTNDCKVYRGRYCRACGTVIPER